MIISESYLFISKYFSVQISVTFHYYRTLVLYVIHEYTHLKANTNSKSWRDLVPSKKKGNL